MRPIIRRHRGRGLIAASAVVAGAARSLPMRGASRPWTGSKTFANTAAQPSGAKNGATMPGGHSRIPSQNAVCSVRRMISSCRASDKSQK